MALSFISNFWTSSPNPNILSFNQRKKPRFDNLSFPNSYNVNNNNNNLPRWTSPTSFPNTPLIVQNDNNSFFSRRTNTNFPSFSNNNNTFLFPELQKPFPCDNNHFPDQFLDGFSPNNPQLLTDEERVLLAPLLTGPQVGDFGVVWRDDDVVCDRKLGVVLASDEVEKAVSNGGGGPTGVPSPQSVAARERRRRITEKTQELGKLIPGGNKMTTAEMFQAAYKYIKFLQAQVGVLQSIDSSIREKKEEPLHIKELQVLASPVVQQKLYSEEKCLVPGSFLIKP